MCAQVLGTLSPAAASSDYIHIVIRLAGRVKAVQKGKRVVHTLNVLLK